MIIREKVDRVWTEMYEDIIRYDSNNPLAEIWLKKLHLVLTKNFSEKTMAELDRLVQLGLNLEQEIILKEKRRRLRLAKKKLKDREKKNENKRKGKSSPK